MTAAQLTALVSASDPNRKTPVAASEGGDIAALIAMSNMTVV